MNRALKIIEYHNKAIGAARDFIKYAILAGEELTQQKAEEGHGNWLPWIKENLPFSEDTAQDYIKAYKERAKYRAGSEFEPLYKFIGKSHSVTPTKSKLTQEEQFQQKWDKEQKEKLEADARLAQRRAEYLASGGVIQEFPVYQTEFDQFWEGIKTQYPREKQVEIALELIKYLWNRYPELAGNQFRVIEGNN